MFFVLLRPFFFCGLEVERLTLAATFFFILLFPCGQYGTSGLPRLWKLGKWPPMATKLPRGGRPLYTAESLDASTAPKQGQILVVFSLPRTKREVPTVRNMCRGVRPDNLGKPVVIPLPPVPKRDETDTGLLERAGSGLTAKL